MALSVESYFAHNYPAFEKFPDIIRNGVIRLFKNIFHENEINEFLDVHKNLDPFSFSEVILEYFNLDISINKNQLTRIPSYGRCVIIANHPLGALDAIALIHVLQDIRKDIKIVASSFLSNFENLISIGRGESCKS